MAGTLPPPSRRLAWGELLRRTFYLLLAIGYLWLGSGLLTSTEFAIAESTVSGNRFASTESILAAADARGQNIFTTPSSQLAARIAKVPAVQRSSVTLAFPNRMIIEVEERIPTLVWLTNDHKLLVDREGVVMTDTQDEWDLPIVHDRKNETLDLGDRIPPSVVSEGEKLWAFGPQLGLAFGADLGYSNAEGFVVQQQKNLVVRLGVGGDVESKVRLLQAINGALAREPKPVTAIDLRFDGRAYLVEATPTPVPTPTSPAKVR